MSSSSINKFAVFDFNEEDEKEKKKVEKISSNMICKILKPNKPPSSKYVFLQAFAHGSTPQSKAIHVDPIDRDDDEESKYSPKEVTYKPLEVDDNNDDDASIGSN
jgi:hypothetical protein